MVSGLEDGVDGRAGRRKDGGTDANGGMDGSPSRALRGSEPLAGARWMDVDVGEVGWKEGEWKRVGDERRGWGT